MYTPRQSGHSPAPAAGEGTAITLGLILGLLVVLVVIGAAVGWVVVRRRGRGKPR
jgi:hypothetical protein